MPIHFRCAFCSQLLGIARRKSGSVINCPTCGGPLVVPRMPGDAQDQPEDESAPANRLLEECDFDVLLQPPATAGAVEASVLGTQPASGAVGSGAPQPAARPPPPAAAPGPATHISNGSDLKTPVSHLVKPAGILMTPRLATFLAVGMVLLLALVFTIGLLLGRASV